MNLSDRDKRILKIAGPVLGGILLLFLLFNLFSGGGGEAASPPGPVVPTSPAPPPEVSPSPEPSASTVVVFAGRDPFAIPSALASATLSPVPTSPGTVPTSPGTSPTSSVSPTTSPTAPTGGNSQDFTGRTIVLIDVFSRSGEDLAQVTVNDNPYTVSEGERFARSFELVDVAGSCANFLYVEESFTLCTNAPK
jgi:hypothetical protein